MCGIVGIVRWDGAAVSREDLSRLNSAIHHRGPDEEGYFQEDGVGLAMRRLSIIDLAGGSQPIYSTDRRFVIVFNGEVYNYREIRAELERSGYVFSTSSDTEVVLAGYQRWGPDVLARMNGMWGFAIYDREKRELFLSRDRLGKKQIYYAFDGRSFVFGSEMKVPMLFSDRLRRLRVEALPEFLTYSYIGGPRTAIEGIDLLPEAHYAVVGADGKIDLRPYWTSRGVSSGAPRNEAEAADEIYHQLTDAVKLRLVADVPIAVMLSSGLDSSSLAFIIAKELGAKLTTFSLGYGDVSFDESADAGDLAKRLDLPWEGSRIDGSDVRAAFPDYIRHIDSLQANTAQLVYYFVSKMIRDAGFKVALNGSGGDELFAGYPTYRANTIFRYYRTLPGVVKSGLHRAANLVPPSFGRVSLDYKLKKFTECSYDDAYSAHGYWRTIFSKETLGTVLSPAVRQGLPPFTRIYDEAFSGLNEVPGSLRKLLYSDLKAWLIPMLPWVDNISMAHSIELRLPFLDYRLVDRALSLPEKYLFRGWKLKRLMKRFLHGRLPDDVLYRRKRGTHLPLSKWLNSELKDVTSHYLDAGVLNREGLFEMAEVQRLLREHREMSADHTFRLWNLVIFSAWKEENRVLA